MLVLHTDPTLTTLPSLRLKKLDYSLRLVPTVILSSVKYGLTMLLSRISLTLTLSPGSKVILLVYRSKLPSMVSGKI